MTVFNISTTKFCHGIPLGIICPGSRVNKRSTMRRSTRLPRFCRPYQGNCLINGKIARYHQAHNGEGKKSQRCNDMLEAENETTNRLSEECETVEMGNPTRPGPILCNIFSLLWYHCKILTYANSGVGQKSNPKCEFRRALTLVNMTTGFCGRVNADKQP